MASGKPTDAMLRAKILCKTSASVRLSATMNSDNAIAVILDSPSPIMDS
jgi:hypothetical protein